MNTKITSENYSKYYFTDGKNSVRIYRQNDGFYTIEYLVKKTFFGRTSNPIVIRMDADISIYRAVSLLHAKGYTEVEPLFEVKVKELDNE